MSRATCLIMHDAVLNNPPRTLIRALSTCVTGQPGVWSRACTYVKINLQAPLKKKPAGDLTALTNDDRLLAGCCCFLPGRPMASRTYGRGTGGLLSVSAGTLRHSVGAQLRADRDVNGAARPFTRQLAPRAGRARLAVHASSSRLPSCDCESRPAGWFAARCSRRSFRGAPRAAASRPAGLTASLTAQSQAHSDRLLSS